MSQLETQTGKLPSSRFHSNRDCTVEEEILPSSPQKNSIGI